MSGSDNIRSNLNIVQGILIGGEDYLFLTQGAHHVIDVITGQRPISEETIKTFRENLLFRRETARNSGVKYLHLICPDKQSVLQAQFPIKNPLCLGEVHLNASPDIKDTVLYPLTLLQQMGTQVFRKTDTHMTDYGSALVAAAIVDRVTGEDHTDWLNEIVQRITVERTEEGDLGSKLTPPVMAREYFFKSQANVKGFSNKFSAGNNGIVDIFFSSDAPSQQRVLWFGDSFGRNCVKILANFFKEVVFLRSPHFHSDIFDQIKPDILITQNVERYLEACEPDSLRPSFFMYPYLANKGYIPGQAFARAFSAVLSYPRQPYHDFVDGLFASPR